MPENMVFGGDGGKVVVVLRGVVGIVGVVGVEGSEVDSRELGEVEKGVEWVFEGVMGFEGRFEGEVRMGNEFRGVRALRRRAARMPDRNMVLGRVALWLVDI